MFEAASQGEGRSKISDWMLRGAIAFVFLLFGFEKFPSGADGPWIRFFDQVGWGQWFRYATGVVEVAGAVLVAVPVTARFGLAILAATMAGASFIHAFVLHHPENCIITGAFFLALTAMWWMRRASA
jgi:putative oxidoreductase